MGLTDVTGVFSRYFIVGFFLPSFFGIALLKITLSDNWVPSSVDPDSSKAFLVIGGLAVLLGLVLLGLRDPLVYLISGYPFIRDSTTRLYRVVRTLSQPALNRQLDMFEDLTRKARPGKGETQREFAARRQAQWQLDLRFPNASAKVLPSRLGNTIRAWEDHARTRWSLETVVVWPRISAFLSEQEGKLHADAETDFAFFFNSAISAAVVGAAMAVNGAVVTPHPFWLKWIYIAPFLFAYLFYRASVGAARRWGHHVKASIDLHRFEFYEKLGVRPPETSAETIEVGGAINRMLLYGESIPDALLSTPAPRVASGGP